MPLLGELAGVAIEATNGWRGEPDLVSRRIQDASHGCYDIQVAKRITQRELRNESGEIMRALDRGESFVVTRNGTPVGELTPLRRRRFVAAEAAMAAFASAPAVDFGRFRADVDTLLDQGSAPRG